MIFAVKGRCPKPLDERAVKLVTLLLQYRAWILKPRPGSTSQVVLDRFHYLHPCCLTPHLLSPFATVKCSNSITSLKSLVRPAGLEPALPREQDFKSRAATNFTTSAYQTKSSTMSKNSQSLDYVLNIVYVDDNVKKFFQKFWHRC